MTKDSVLAILKSAQGYVSGEKISAEVGVSRMAVSAAVKALRGEGYAIRSATNRGYCLEDGPDRLTAGELMAEISPQRMESVLCLDSVDSTNRRLREMAYEGAPEGQVVVANAQTQGRGRLGRTFHSPGDQGIYLSMLLRPGCAPGDSVSLTAWAAVAVCRAIGAVAGVMPGIKWVNDLQLGGKKLCGILTEMAVESETGRIQHVIVGVGVNVLETRADFPEELGEIATSLAIETGKRLSRARLAARIIRELDRVREEWPGEKAAYLAAYRAGSVTVGQNIRILREREPKEGRAAAINEDFSLAVEFPDGRRENLSSGEVSVRSL